MYDAVHCYISSRGCLETINAQCMCMLITVFTFASDNLHTVTVDLTETYSIYALNILPDTYTDSLHFVIATNLFHSDPYQHTLCSYR